jgi:hypothetical protein
MLSAIGRTGMLRLSGIQNGACHYHFIFFKRSLRIIALRFLIAFAKRFFLRIIFSALRSRSSNSAPA